jgi:photosystem II stability/assembly factor-like uncharacterized protein
MVPAPGKTPKATVNLKVLAAIFVLALLASTVVLGWRLMTRSGGLSHPQNHSAPTPQYLSFPAPADRAFCSGVRARHWATSPPTTAKMINASTGWAYGPQRTTDGGSHWVDVSPPSIPGRTPINDQFFLDSMHAWVAETAGSSKTCVDHVVVLSTADGGRTWEQAAPIPVRFAGPTDYVWAAPSSAANWFSFIDAQNGWLLVGSGPAVVTPSGEWPGLGQRWTVGDVYRTTDGGLHWTLVSTNPGSRAGCHGGSGMSFSTATTGWIVSDCGLLVTRNGGTTWGNQAVPVTPVDPPQFFGDQTGVLLGVEGLAVTSDGGATWNLRSLPGANFVDFINPREGWAVSFLGNDQDQAEFGLYQTSDAAQSWTPIHTTSPLALGSARFWGTKGQDAGAWGLDFVDSKNGFWTICGGPPGPCMGNGLFKTTDAGHTWTSIEETVEGS